jgi:hypothetical protein
MVRRMFEYASVSASAYDVNSLVGKLNEKASDGWEVVSIVPTGGDVTAFLKRSSASGNGESAEMLDEDDTGGEPRHAGDVAAAAAAGDVQPVTPISEPAGWGSEPGTTATEEPAAAESEWSPAATGAAAGAAGSEWAPTTTTATEEPARSAPEPEPAPAVAAPAAAAQASAPTTPAGWYPDPSGRYEMRYWDGDKWTEHVSRQGQTFTDPPVA